MRKWYCHCSSQRTIASYIFMQPVLSCNPQLGTCALPTESSKTRGDLLVLLGHGASTPIAHLLLFLHSKLKHCKPWGFPSGNAYSYSLCMSPFLLLAPRTFLYTFPSYWILPCLWCLHRSALACNVSPKPFFSEWQYITNSVLPVLI